MRRSDRRTGRVGLEIARAALTMRSFAPRRRAPGDVEEHLLHGLAAIAGDELARRALVDDPAGLHHQHVIAHALDLEHVVRCEQQRGAGVAAVARQMGAHPVGRVGIERGRRLVEQQHARLVDQRLGQAHPRLLARRELAGGAVEDLAELELALKGRDPPFQVVHAVEMAVDGQVLAHRDPQRHVDVGAFEVHQRLDLGALGKGVDAEDAHGPAARQH
jgi:hypothetical protein